MEINDLPTELLARCLREACGPFRKREAQYTSHLAILCSVCQTWQATAAGDAVLWTNIFIQSLSDLDDVAQAIARSKDLPLTIHLRLALPDVIEAAAARDPTVDVDDFADRLVSLLVTVLHRCHDISISAPGRAQANALVPLLFGLSGESIRNMTLDIDIPDCDYAPGNLDLPHLFDGFMPNLHALTFRGQFIYWGAAAYYRHLRVLSLVATQTSPTVDQILEILTCTSRLQKLVLRTTYDFSPAITLPPPTLHDLETLEISCANENSAKLVGMISAPHLKNVLIHSHASDLLHIRRQCAFSFPVVDRLAISGSIEVDNFHHFLGIFPNLRHLDVRSCVIATYWFGHDEPYNKVSESVLAALAIDAHTWSSLATIVIGKDITESCDKTHFFTRGTNSVLLPGLSLWHRVGQTRSFCLTRMYQGVPTHQFIPYEPPYLF